MGAWRVLRAMLALFRVLACRALVLSSQDVWAILLCRVISVIIVTIYIVVDYFVITVVVEYLDSINCLVIVCIGVFIIYP